MLGNESTYEYNSKGQMTRDIGYDDPEGREVTISYNNYDEVSHLLHSSGREYFFDYDYSNTTQEYYACIRSSAGWVREVWYDRTGDTRRIDINGITVQNISKDGRNLLIFNENNLLTEKDIDLNGNLTHITYPDGTEVSYDCLTRIDKISAMTDQKGVTSTFAYHDNGDLAQMKLGANTADPVTVDYVTQYDQNPYGIDLITLNGDDDTLSATIKKEYDQYGNPVRVTDAEGNVREYTYDVMGNVLTATDPRGNTWTYAYDARGRLLSVTDPLDRTTAYEYDLVNNLTAMVNARGRRFEYEYDSSNNLVKAIDPYNKFTCWEYNINNQPVRITDQEHRQAIFEYDVSARLIKRTDGAGNAVVYHYDDSLDSLGRFNQPDSIDYHTFTRNFVYDILGRVVQATDDLRDGRILTRTYTYDEACTIQKFIRAENQSGRGLRAENQIKISSDF